MKEKEIALLMNCLHQDQDRLEAAKLETLSIQEWENLIRLATNLRVRLILFRNLKNRGLENMIPEQFLRPHH